MKRDSWSEADIDDLPLEESDNFERKSGALFDDRNAFLNALAKAASAFANSGGGSLILGVKDDGVPDGLPAQMGRATMRDWIEQKLPNLLSYPLSDFRVHTVARADVSRIPSGRVVVVIDFGDSLLAPHQDTKSHLYYVRQAGRSIPASHSYIELLRQRLTSPTLDFNLEGIEAEQFAVGKDYVFVEFQLKFRLENTGRVAAYKWQLNPRAYTHDRENGLDIHFSREKYPVKMPETRVPVRFDYTILPGCYESHNMRVGMALRPLSKTAEAMMAEVRSLENLTMTFSLATENCPGEPKEFRLGSHFKVNKIVGKAVDMIPDFFEP
ncbi:AlbA family DNA-binding domain-containing protein [Amaricoccus solimangrovi]|nr:ATP-binding protein [Amaricoccus solimangrovi]